MTFIVTDNKSQEKFAAGINFDNEEINYRKNHIQNKQDGANKYGTINK